MISSPAQQCSQRQRFRTQITPEHLETSQTAQPSVCLVRTPAPKVIYTHTHVAIPRTGCIDRVQQGVPAGRRCVINVCVRLDGQFPPNAGLVRVVQMDKVHTDTHAHWRTDDVYYVTSTPGKCVCGTCWRTHVRACDKMTNTYFHALA